MRDTKAETIKIKNSAGDEVIINKPKQRALKELALAEKEERTPNLPEHEREDAANFILWTSRGFKEAK